MPKYQYIVRRSNVLEPAQEFETEWNPGDMVEVAITRPRNQAHHRKFWALVSFLADNFDVSKDEMVDVVKICGGHCTRVTFKSGKTRLVPKSISFAAMDQSQFEAFYNRALDGLIDKFIPNGWGKKEDLERCADEVLKGWG